jgi:resuscitation-promoting factor RpfB
VTRAARRPPARLRWREFIVAAGIFVAVLVAAHGGVKSFHLHLARGAAGTSAASVPATPVQKGAVTEAGPAACGCQVTTMPQAANEQLANRMAAGRGWGRAQQTCLDLLWTYESASTWSPTVMNPTPGAHAYGIPQALPAGKMATAGADWMTNPETQITWGLRDIKTTYGTPCAAWSHELEMNWY